MGGTLKRAGGWGQVEEEPMSADGWLSKWPGEICEIYKETEKQAQEKKEVKDMRHLNLSEWREEMWKAVDNKRWMDVCSLLNTHPQHHAIQAAMLLAQADLEDDVVVHLVALRCFRVLLERWVKHEPFAVNCLTQVAIMHGRQRQLEEIFTLDDPTVRRQLHDIEGLRTARSLLVDQLCRSRVDLHSGTGARTARVACLTLAIKQGLFADASTKGVNPFSWVCTPMCKAVYYEQPDLVRFLVEVGATCHREMTELLSLAERDAWLRPNTTSTSDSEERRPPNSILPELAVVRRMLYKLKALVYASSSDVLVPVTGRHPNEWVLFWLIPMEGELRWSRRRFLPLMPRKEARDIAEILRTALTQPCSLQTLCLRTVSRGLAHCRGRDWEVRVRRLPLPGALKQRVQSFHSPVFAATYTERTARDSWFRARERHGIHGLERENGTESMV